MTLMLPFVLEKGFSVDMYGYLMSIETLASLICAALLGIIKLKPKTRYYAFTIGFISSVLLYISAYLSTNFIVMAILMFLGCFANCIGNAIFNASLMLALPENNRGAILGLVSASSTGGSALSAVIFGVLCDIFPLTIVFVIGNILSILPMVYLCIHPNSKQFILEH